MNIDLHTHSIIGSPCSRQTIREIASGAMANGIDAVCLTDHNNMHGKDEAELVSRDLDFPIFVGMEVTCEEGDLLIFGCTEREGFPRLPYEDLKLLLDPWKCAVIPAHPFRGGIPNGRMPEIIYEFSSDFVAIEAYSLNMSDRDSDDAIALAADVGLQVVACADSHFPGTAGLDYTEFDDDIASVEQLVYALKKGRFQAVRNDYAWKAENL